MYELNLQQCGTYSNHRRPFHGFKSILGYSIDKGYTPNFTKGVIQKSKNKKQKFQIGIYRL